MENNEPNTKIQVASRVDPEVFAVIERIAKTDERTISNTIERLLKGNPQVAEILETAQAEGAGA